MAQTLRGAQLQEMEVEMLVPWLQPLYWLHMKWYTWFSCTVCHIALLNSPVVKEIWQEQVDGLMDHYKHVVTPKRSQIWKQLYLHFQFQHISPASVILELWISLYNPLNTVNQQVVHRLALVCNKFYLCKQFWPPSSWLHNGDVLCFLRGTNWIYICYVEESILPLRSSGQRSGFDSRCYQIFWEVLDLERGPLSLETTTEELLEYFFSSLSLSVSLTSGAQYLRDNFNSPW
jgi:hypothetical protein